MEETLYEITTGVFFDGSNIVDSQNKVIVVAVHRSEAEHLRSVILTTQE